MNIDEVEFNSSAVRPMDCLREGWELIKDNYWLFFGISFVGVFISGMGPLGILIGPMMCGIYLCLLQQERGKRVSFDMLFQGFNFFVPSLIATLIEVVPIVILAGVWYAGILVGSLTLAANARNQQGPPPGWTLALFFVWYLGGIFLLILTSVLLKLFLLFSYFLIVDKNVSGGDAVRLSFRAARANIGGLLALLLLNMLMTFVGLLFCFVGAYLEIPLTYAMYTMAYRQVFPHHDPFARFAREYDDEPDEDDDEDDRPRRSADADTAVKVDPANS